ncbi:ABC transporter substrate-binding protein [Noviherbaspirillum pedocola]|uniref:ABC transporter substrate-binding protein n=1 Tax=Noviherbaspirillum pedocola TaxID=2801341 RepID=A0A934T1L9_9BURK|nr:ABC transporter substrate-binding protein [Noviherbaspirillum pedocola]MBK4737387.1 ABC transporter substrate-binding protein [Noviherbaspirillum pedocola]
MMTIHHSRRAFGSLIAALALSFSIPAAAQEMIRIGFVAPMSGNYGAYGQGFYNSMRAYMANYGDTVAGKKVEIIVRDNTTNTPDNARRLAQELASRDKVDFLAGFALTPDALAVASVATAAKKPTIVMLAATAGLTAKSPYIARVSYSNGQTSATMAKWAYKNGVRKVYTLVSDFASGIDCEEAFKKTFEAQGGKIIGGTRMALASLDYSPFVQRAKDAAPDAIYLFVPSGDPMIAFMKAYTEKALPQAGVKLMTSTDLADEYIRPLGDTAQYLINTVQYFDTLDNDENKRYTAAYQKIAGRLPGAIAVGGYDGMAVIYETAKKLNGQIDPDKAMAAIKGIKIKSPRGNLTIDPETRDTVANMYVAKVEKREGRYVPVVIDTFTNVTEGR